MKRLLGYIVLALLAVFVLVVVIAGALGFVPVLLLFAGCWWASPMTWESEFEHQTRMLLKP